MNKVIYLLILLKIGSIQSVCFENSFNLTKYDPIVDETKITLIIRVTTNQPNMYEYTTECFDKLVVIAQSLTDKKQIDFNLDQNATNEINFYKLENLEPLSLYNITLGYKMKTSDKLIEQLSFESFSCFSTPGEPVDLKAVLDINSLKISWKKPLIIGAPDICYYLVIRRFLDQSKGTEYEVTENSYTFTGDDLKRSFEVRVSTFNDYKCYKNQYPVAEKCKQIGQIKTSSKIVSYMYKTQSENSSICLKLSLKLCLFILFIFKLFD